MRKALVARLDGLNAGLRGLMAAIDKAVPDDGQRIARPAPLELARRRLVCRVDCLLRGLPRATDAVWAYLRPVARFLDGARLALGRLAAAPAQRPPGPTLAQLTRLFNDVAQASNESIGLALLARRAPGAPEQVDASSFRAKVRRWRDRLQTVIDAFGRSWLPLVQRDKPAGPALDRAVGLRVALARLGQRLADLAGEARRLSCRRGPGCAKPQARWEAAQAAVRRVGDQLERAGQKLRAAGPAPTLAAGRKVSEATDKSFAALRQAALAL